MGPQSRVGAVLAMSVGDGHALARRGRAQTPCRLGPGMARFRGIRSNVQANNFDARSRSATTISMAGRVGSMCAGPAFSGVCPGGRPARMFPEVVDFVPQTAWRRCSRCEAPHTCAARSQGIKQSSRAHPTRRFGIRIPLEGLWENQQAPFSFVVSTNPAFPMTRQVRPRGTMPPRLRASRRCVINRSLALTDYFSKPATRQRRPGSPPCFAPIHPHGCCSAPSPLR